MSSNIISRPIPFENYSVVFFGAQKKKGAAGITVVIARKSLLVPLANSKIMRKLGLPVGPIALSWGIINKNKSLYNTLPIHNIFIASEVLKNSLNTFPNKVAGQTAVSQKKAELIYGALDKESDRFHVCLKSFI